jgi:ribosomal protein S12 methylthiotransferase accessory factor
MTSEVGIPAYVCIVVDDPDQPEQIHPPAMHHGYGCHLEPSVALMRALTEAVQSRLTFISGARDNILRGGYRTRSDRSLLRDVLSEITNPPFLESFNVQGSLAGETFEDDLAMLLDKLRDVNVEQVVVVDLSRPEFNIPVVKVIVPGLDILGEEQAGVRVRKVRVNAHAS